MYEIYTFLFIHTEILQNIFRGILYKQDCKTNVLENKYF